MSENWGLSGTRGQVERILCHLVKLYSGFGIGEAALALHPQRAPALSPVRVLPTALEGVF